MKYLKRKSILLSLLLLLVLAVSGIVLMTNMFDTPLLFSEKGAAWIYIDRPFVMEAQREGERISYRTSFSVEQPTLSATLTIRAFGVPDVYIDGRRILPSSSIPARWKNTRTFDLSGVITPGRHELYIRVFNKNGPAVLLAASAPLNLFTGPRWEASYDELLWTKAVPVDKKKDPELAGYFDSTGKAFLSLLPFYALLFLAVFFLSRSAPSPGYWRQKIGSTIITPSGVRWMLLVFWTILAINNILKLPLSVGMDIQEHYEYIEYVANTGRIPLAPQGWQMFQSPLYYILSAFLWQFSPLTRWFEMNTSMQLLRIIPLLCGLAQVELAYRAARAVFPLRRDLQIWTTIIGGLLPMNLYISQVVSNEPLLGLFSAGAVVIGFHLLAYEREAIPARYFIFLGAALGLALLTKATAVLLVPPAVMLIVYVLYKRRQPFRDIISRVLLVGGIVFVIAGWYYVRNWIELGRPFVGGWESTAWWQDPGYRTVSDFFTFGRSLYAPIYSAVQGFWDSLYATLWLDGGLSGIGEYRYRPPWNYQFMLSGALLALLPTAGLLMGSLTAIRRSSDQDLRAQVFSVLCMAIYGAALLYLYLTVPIWSTAKATYTLGLAPCYAIVCVTGLDVLSKNALLRSIINAGLACWAVAAYCSYFIL
jgi:hypothetical protein